MQETYRCYWKQDGKLCRMDADNVADFGEAIEAVKENLGYAKTTADRNIKICVLAVVK